MNRTTLTVAFTLVACVSAGRVVAQGTQTRPQAPATQPTANATANVPVSKMAVIYSAEFQDPKTGIARFNNTLNKLNSEFQKIGRSEPDNAKTQDTAGRNHQATASGRRNSGPNSSKDRHAGSAKKRIHTQGRGRQSAISKALSGSVFTATGRCQQGFGRVRQSARHHNDHRCEPDADSLCGREHGYYQGVH